MTKKQWLAVAESMGNQIASTTDPQVREALALVSRNLAFHFAEINGAFQYHLFYEACGLLPDGHTPQSSLASVGFDREDEQ